MIIAQYYNELRYYQRSLAQELGGQNQSSSVLASVLDGFRAFDAGLYHDAILILDQVIGRVGGEVETIIDFTHLLARCKIASSGDEMRNLYDAWLALYKNCAWAACLFEAANVIAHFQAETALKHYRDYCLAMGGHKNLLRAKPSIVQCSIINKILAEVGEGARLEWQKPSVASALDSEWVQRVHIVSNFDLSYIQQNYANQSKWKNIRLVFDRNVQHGDWVFFLATKVGWGKFQDFLDKFPKERRIYSVQEPIILLNHDKNLQRQFFSQECNYFGHMLYFSQNKGYFYGKSHTAPQSFIYLPTHAEPDIKIFSHFDSDKDKDKLLTATYSRLEHLFYHKQRSDFLFYLKSKLDHKIDLFGSGFLIETSQNNKFSRTLKSYKYAIAIENTVEYNFITEKVYDACLADCFIFYFGTAQVQDHFDMRGIRVIDIFKPEEALRIIEQTIADGAYEKNIDAIRMNRKLALYNHPFMNQLWKIVNFSGD